MPQLAATFVGNGRCRDAQANWYSHGGTRQGRSVISCQAYCLRHFTFPGLRGFTFDPSADHGHCLCQVDHNFREMLENSNFSVRDMDPTGHGHVDSVGTGSPGQVCYKFGQLVTSFVGEGECFAPSGWMSQYPSGGANSGFTDVNQCRAYCLQHFTFPGLRGFQWSRTGSCECLVDQRYRDMIDEANVSVRILRQRSGRGPILTAAVFGVGNQKVCYKFNDAFAAWSQGRRWCTDENDYFYPNGGVNEQLSVIECQDYCLKRAPFPALRGFQWSTTRCLCVVDNPDILARADFSIRSNEAYQTGRGPIADIRGDNQVECFKFEERSLSYNAEPPRPTVPTAQSSTVVEN